MERALLEYSYETFMIEEAYNQKMITAYLNECVALESGDLKSVAAINESAVDGVLAVIKKIVGAIKKLWNKFIERVGEVLTSDVAWLTKYKDIILNKPFKDRNVTMYEYASSDSIRQKYNVPEFNSVKFNTVIKAENTEAEFINTHLAGYNFKPDEPIKEQIIIAIRGEEEKEFSILKLDKTEMYDYCINFKEKTVKELKKEQDRIDAIQNEVEKQVASMSKQVDTISSEKKTTKDENEANIKVADLKVKEQSSIYSTVLGSYINELSTGKVIEKGNTENGSSASNPSSKPDISSSKPEINKAVEDNIPTSGSDADLKSAQDSFSKIRENCPKYFTCCGNILAAKETVFLNKFKDYRTLLRIHVRDYVADAK